LVVTIIALLSWVHDTVTASWETAVKTACSGCTVAVEGAVVAQFGGVQDTVSAISGDAVVSAACVGTREVGVVDTVVACLVDTVEEGVDEGVVFDTTVTTRAVGELGEVVDELFEEGRRGWIGVGGVVGAIEEEGSSEFTSESERAVVIIDHLHVVLLVVQQVLSGSMELDSVESVSVSVVFEPEARGGIDGRDEEVTRVVDASAVLEFAAPPVSIVLALMDVDGLEDVDGRLVRSAGTSRPLGACTTPVLGVGVVPRAGAVGWKFGTGELVFGDGEAVV